ncbi:ATP-binding cassette domain-containing protein [Brevundimonas poindexterae]|uniref:ATP-binding cassette domain-containing protein n=1 Tax=Brevundimonas poindexterae TaxID=74325 RepID=UPI001CFD454D|nr:ABC transporter ATP-binding protein [Brevundimonas poindexterae]
MTAAVELFQASVERSGRRVIRPVDMAVPAGGWFGLIGANGSGKTSLLRAIAGRLPFSGGRCLIDGVDLAGERTARAGHFGFAPPADRLPEALRVRDLLELVGGDPDTALARMGPVGDALGIEALCSRRVGDCSAGMRQRAAVALAFAGGPRRVILDEPFNWLDPVAAFDLREALRVRVDDGLTLITALHDLGTLATVCNAGLMLVDGRVALTLDRERLAEAAADPRRFERRTIDLLRSGAPATGHGTGEQGCRKG